MPKKRPVRHNKPWTKKDEDTLRDMYRQKVVHRVIASKMKRTLNAVESKATELKLAGKRRKSRR
jgi:hypothetical protein